MPVAAHEPLLLAGAESELAAAFQELERLANDGIGRRRGTAGVDPAELA